MKYKKALNATKTDLEFSLKDLFSFLEILFDDNRNLKLKAFEPDKKMAKALLEYLSWQEDKQKKKFETVYAKELEFFEQWVKIYCKENNCSKQDALLRIIER